MGSAGAEGGEGAAGAASSPLPGTAWAAYSSFSSASSRRSTGNLTFGRADALASESAMAGEGGRRRSGTAGAQTLEPAGERAGLSQQQSKRYAGGRPRARARAGRSVR